jgi:predicted acylesterase/phospholipase RssA
MKAAVGATRRATVAACVAVLLLAAGCSGPAERPKQTSQKLAAARAEDDLRRQGEQAGAVERNLARIKAEHDEFAAGRAPAPPVVDLLIVSGGADWGAFGAGYLKGWGTVTKGEMARPAFDVVTGVSTGALIAPFAFLGDDASIEKVVHLYRNPSKDWVKRRSLLSVAGGSSFVTIPGLERELKRAVDLPMLGRIAEAGSTGRLLIVSATDLDTEEMRAWDIVEEARRALRVGDTRRTRQVLLASTAVPGIFPPREIDGVLYVDGGVTGNIQYGGRRAGGGKDSFLARWQATYPEVKFPKVRYWVIFNNEVRWPPETVQPKWPSLLAKSSTAATRSATLNAIRKLFLQAELARLKSGADVEVRYVAVPDGWTPASPKPFDRASMNALADLGERMGADPSSWRTEPP